MNPIERSNRDIPPTRFIRVVPSIVPGLADHQHWLLEETEYWSTERRRIAPTPGMAMQVTPECRQIFLDFANF